MTHFSSSVVELRAQRVLLSSKGVNSFFLLGTHQPVEFATCRHLCMVRSLAKHEKIVNRSLTTFGDRVNYLSEMLLGLR